MTAVAKRPVQCTEYSPKTSRLTYPFFFFKIYRWLTDIYQNASTTKISKKSLKGLSKQKNFSISRWPHGTQEFREW